MSKINEDFFKELEDVLVYKIDENTNKKSPDDPDVIASAICSSLAFQVLNVLNAMEKTTLSLDVDKRCLKIFHLIIKKQQ